MDEREIRINEAAESVKSRIGAYAPKIGIVLGSGLGNIADEIEDAVVIPYTSIPGFPQATAIGHKGNFIVGRFAGKEVIAMQGRFHAYEGYSMDIVTLPIRVMKRLGIETLFVSNAAGGMLDGFKIGDLMIIEDHINMMPNPLIGRNLDSFGERFPDMTRPYDRGLIALAEKEAEKLGIMLWKGVYLAVTGPCYETIAEYRFFKMIGAGAVGMSTIPEVIVARHSGLKVFGMSVITDVFVDGDEFGGTDAEEVVVAAQKASVKMTSIFRNVIAEL
ncbi:MAG: purine-nucleoside phosphorylase [Bacteroidales bacterium]|nr:purine-nucleoside phosphorylase [Bacteroidales bacterium]